jgi:Photosynthesis system II assembly factor YCF48/Putative zinc-finger
MDQLPKIVQQGLGRTAKPEVHPDPDLLTAFAEKSLNDRERILVLKHLAGCADCREVLALAMPETATEPAPGLERSSWLTWPILRWGALAACVVVVGAAVTLHYDGGQADRSVAEKAPAAPPTAVLESNAAKESDAQLAMQARPSKVLLDRDFAGAAGNLTKQTEKKSLNAGGAPARTGVPTSQALDASADHPAAPAPTPAAKPAEPEKLAKTRNDAFDYTTRTNNQTVTVESAAATPMEQKAAISELKAKNESSKNELRKEAQAAGAAGGAVLQDRKADTLSAATETVEVTSGAYAKRSRVKGNSLRWTISPDGGLQRSFDSGKNWQSIPVASGVVFRALTANDYDIWVGGAAGVLYHSSDGGEHWTQIKPTADGRSLTSDIITLEFSDASHGKLTTSNQETWITSDAGETWQSH